MKKIYNPLLLMIFLGLFSACDGFLERYPLDGPSAETYLASESDLTTALNGIYHLNSVPPVYGIPTVLILDACTDIGFDRNTSGLQQLGNGNADTNNDYVLTLWKHGYQIIGRCNFLLDNMHKAESSMPEKRYHSIAAEARFLRAYVYHYLNEMFGGVPLVTEMINLDKSHMSRSSKEEVVEFILKELEEAARDLSGDYNGRGRATQAAALSLKARVALYHGRWDVASKAAQEVMALNRHSLHPDFNELFQYKGSESKEIIWAHQFLTAANLTHMIYAALSSRNGKGYSNKVPSQTLVDAYQCIDGLNIDKSPLYNPLKPFDNRDPRLAATIVLPGSRFLNYQFETHRDSVECWNYNETPAIRIANQDAINAYASFTGYCWRKYVDLEDKNRPHNSPLNTTIIRYAEVLLTYAEAKIEANQIDASVYEAINSVRQRTTVNMPPIPEGLTQAQLRSVVRKERMYELAMEGFRLYDIRRWEIADKVMEGPFYGRVQRGLLSAAPLIDENGIAHYEGVSNKDDLRIVEQRHFNNVNRRNYLFPIPERERTANPNLTQNPGY